MDIRFPIEKEEEQFEAALHQIFEEQVEALSEKAVALLKELWRNGYLHGQQHKLHAAIVEGLRRAHYDTDSHIVTLNLPPNFFAESDDPSC